MLDNYNFLPAFASFVLRQRLSQIAELYLERATFVDQALLKLLDDKTEAEKLQILQSNYSQLLQSLAEGRGKQHALDSIELWKSNRYPYIKRDQAGATDLVTAINIRKYTFIKVLREYTTDLETREQVILELVDYYSFYFIKLMEAFGEMQEEKLIREKEFSQSIIKNCVDGIAAYDLEWNVTEWNPAMERINNIARKDIVGKSYYDLFPDYKYSEEAALTSKLFEGEPVYLSDRRYKYGDGWYEAHLIPLHDDRKEITGVLSITHDITKRKEAELKIKEDQHFIQSITDTSPDVITVYDLEKGKNLYSSKEIYELLEYEPNKLAELVEKGVQGLIEVIHPDDLPVVIGFLESYKTYTGNKARDLEYRIKDNTGKYRWILDRYNVFKRSLEGLPVQIIGVARDNTIRKVAEEEVREANFKLHETNEELLRTEELLKEANNELEERVQLRTTELLEKNKQLTRINADLDNFIYSASHDLKVPITNLEGLMISIKKKIEHLIPEKHKVLLEMMEASLQRLKRTIGDLGEITKVQTDIETEPREKVSFQELLADVKSDITGLIQATGAIIEEDFEVKNIHFARKNLRSVLYNLLTNAIKYASPDRTPKVLFRTREEAEFIEFSVHDNGLGIPDNQKDKIFSLFKRLYTNVEGSGIGLYIVKKIIENEEGQIVVESEVDKGSIFRMYFKKSV